ncbi:solute carrier organic anion transporter family member 1C1-like [Kryptolebias marmoratus]|uniref:solute carrier organic anion transporter family member 1C1-like n=1 Tax=Kryptolebias marmoratus TaxID=37003 RepID=UPI0007F91650|nr:solute carrier organic anion transporter family member 1C1-like [Kryptolebias marmoratus]
MKLNDSATSTLKNCHPKLKMFFAALSFAYFSKELSGSYMKSTITQLERRFDIPSYLIGIIDGSFEIGNLLVISFVSYFGAKLHRPKIIAVGCILMSLGTFLIAMPHFTCGRYNMKTSIRSSENATSHLSPCPVNSSSSNNNDRLSLLPSAGCEQESSVSLWMYVLLGNVLRGIGETPVQPLGISYIDDYAQSENAALYIGCVQTIAVIGPAFGFLLGSLCTKIYVDIGFVDTETVTITPEDGHWVGAWWLGYLIAGTITLMSAVPFWFLPKSLPVHVDKHDSSCTQDQTRFIKDSPNMDHKIRPEEPANLRLMANEFVPTLKSLLRNPVYIIYLCVTIIQFNSLIGMVTYKPKYIEQHYGQSASKANFLMGMINIPAVAFGMFSGAVVMKKYKLGVLGATKFAFGTSLLGYFLSLLFLAMSCENSKVAGITVSYAGVEDISYEEWSLFSDCNSDCLCSSREWDLVCGENGITYVSPCLAGCTSSTGSGKNMMFDNCRCVEVTNGLPVNLTATLGQCLPRDSCDRVFPYFLAVSVFSSFIISLGGTPGFMLLVRCIKPELKSLALGIYTLATRTLAGIPAPIYFGAIIDSTCLKWGYNTCGEKDVCRIYNTSAFRTVYLGLTLGLRAVSFLLCIWGFALLKRHIKREEEKFLTNGKGELEFLRQEESGSDCEQSMLASDCSPDRETHL